MVEVGHSDVRAVPFTMLCAALCKHLLLPVQTLDPESHGYFFAEVYV